MCAFIGQDLALPVQWRHLGFAQCSLYTVRFRQAALALATEDLALHLADLLRGLNVFRMHVGSIIAHEGVIVHLASLMQVLYGACARVDSPPSISNRRRSKSMDNTRLPQIESHAGQYASLLMPLPSALPSRITVLANAQPSSVIARLFKIAVQARQFKDHVMLHLPAPCPVRKSLWTVAKGVNKKSIRDVCFSKLMEIAVCLKPVTDTDTQHWKVFEVVDLVFQ